MVALPSFSPTWAKTVFTDLASAVRRSIVPNDWLKSLASGTPEIFTPLVPSTGELGLKRPVSIAAVAVTTLNVEPGA
jgi:hypothetical protein